MSNANGDVGWHAQDLIIRCITSYMCGMAHDAQVTTNDIDKYMYQALQLPILNARRIRAECTNARLIGSRFFVVIYKIHLEYTFKLFQNAIPAAFCLTAHLFGARMHTDLPYAPIKLAMQKLNGDRHEWRNKQYEKRDIRFSVLLFTAHLCYLSMRRLAVTRWLGKLS